MKKDEKNNITHNRGDKGSIKLTNKNGTFKVEDKFKFSIVEKGDYNKVIFQKEFEVEEETNEFFLTFTNEEMRFSEPISKEKEYYYEIDMNDDTTLVGYDENKHKKFILYPEAVKKEDSR
jgi:hypothetical protein